MTKEVEAELQEQISQQRRWEAMTPEQKKKQLFLNQKELLDKFLARHAISQAQYDKSLGDLMEKMGVA
ncbi:MAG: hypothetical protein IKM73_08245 [Acidaminococcaceae bacterium]|nr:hypothetical protein [Acidaminococcaceae bacterium]